MRSPLSLALVRPAPSVQVRKSLLENEVCRFVLLSPGGLSCLCVMDCPCVRGTTSSHSLLYKWKQIGRCVCGGLSAYSRLFLNGITRQTNGANEWEQMNIIVYDKYCL